MAWVVVEIVDQLINEAPPATVADVESLLEKLAVNYSTVSHPPMFTVEDSQNFRKDVPGGYSKNLFLRNKKGRMALVTLCENRQVDLRELGDQIGLGRVSFGSPQRLMHYLGVRPGAVTPLSVINDVTNQVTAYIDSALIRQHPLHFHPCDNSHTTALSAAELLSYMTACEHAPIVLELDTKF